MCACVVTYLLRERKEGEFSKAAVVTELTLVLRAGTLRSGYFAISASRVKI